MAAYYLAQAVYQSYMSLFYRARGMDAARLGALYALAAAASIPGQLLFGAAADRARVPGRVLRALLLSSAALLLLQTFRATPSPSLRSRRCSASSIRRVQPIGDALALERLAREGKPFGPARLMGALAFAASALVFGFFLDASGREGLVALAAAALMLVALFCSFLLGGESRPRGEVRPLRLLKNRNLLRCFCSSCPRRRRWATSTPFSPRAFWNCPGRRARCWAGRTSSPPLAEIPFLLVGDRLFAALGRGGRGGACHAGAGRALAADGAWGKRMPAAGSTDTARPWSTSPFP